MLWSKQRVRDWEVEELRVWIEELDWSANHADTVADHAFRYRFVAV